MWQVWVILGGVLGALVIFSLISNLVSRGSRLWNELAERYPAQPPGLGAPGGKATIAVTRADPATGKSAAPGCLSVLFVPYRLRHDVEYHSDADHLHMTLKHGAIGSGPAVSIPWATIQIDGEAATHMGGMVALRVDHWVLVVPAQAVRAELEIRRSIQDAPTGTGEDQPPMIDAPPR
jgi:hypothetical protein